MMLTGLPRGGKHSAARRLLLALVRLPLTFSGVGCKLKQIHRIALSSNCHQSVIEPWQAAIRNSGFGTSATGRSSRRTETRPQHQTTRLPRTQITRCAWGSDLNTERASEALQDFDCGRHACCGVRPDCQRGRYFRRWCHVPLPDLAKWADVYKKATGNGLNYQSIGSGGGIKQIKARTVTFGASDMPLKADELAKDGLAQFPTVLGGVVPVVNLEGITPGQLVLDGPTLAKIFLGEVKMWDEPAIKQLNPQAKLPSDAIAIVHRSDGSGTTFIFTDYLSKTSPDWKSKVGANTAVEWLAGIGAKGNEGVANNVAQTRGSIGYVEYAYAKQNKLTFTKMINRDGKPIEPDASAFQGAAANADWVGTPGFSVILTDEPGAQSWPIAGATFILIPKQPPDAEAAAEALKFFAWAYANGGKMAEELDYVPMPAGVVTAIKKMWTNEIKDPGGRPLFAASN
jgi:phosphate transport system substrate-binding protein